MHLQFAIIETNPNRWRSASEASSTRLPEPHAQSLPFYTSASTTPPPHAHSPLLYSALTLLKRRHIICTHCESFFPDGRSFRKGRHTFRAWAAEYGESAGGCGRGKGENSLLSFRRTFLLPIFQSSGRQHSPTRVALCIETTNSHKWTHPATTPLLHSIFFLHSHRAGD